MRRPPRRAPLSLWVLAGVLTLLSVPLAALSALVALAAPASADTVTPVRRCPHGGDYRELDGDSTVMVTAPDGYLIDSYCVDGRGRRGGSEVHTLPSPQRTTVIWHSDGRTIEGYSVTYTRVPASGQPDPDPDPGPGTEEPDAEQGQNEGQGGQGQGGQGQGGQGQNGQGQNGHGQNHPGESSGEEADEEQSGPAAVEETGSADKTDKTDKLGRTSPSPTSEPGRHASESASSQPEGSTRMSPLSDGEELRTTALKAAEDDGEKDELRTLVVAGGIVAIGLLAGVVALLVRLPGQR